MKSTMNADDVCSARLRARIFDAFPVEQPAFLRLLRLLDVEATTDVPTAAVTLGSRSRLLINPDFVRTMCPTDCDLVMLVLHELHHVALGHTRLFPRVTRAQNWAFDCVINAQLSRLYPRPEWTALFRRSYRADAFPEALLRPPEGWNTNGVRWLPGRAGAVHRALYTDASVSYADLYGLLAELAPGAVGFDALLGDHSEPAPGDCPPDLLREVRNILAEWPMVHRVSGRDRGADVAKSAVAREAPRRRAVAQLRRAVLWASLTGSGNAATGRRAVTVAPGVLPYALRLGRADFLRAALDAPSLLHPAEVRLEAPARGSLTHVYLDVSGSMDEHLPLVYAALRPLAAYLHPEVHLFSTRIVDVDLSALRRGVRMGTGGTDVAPVTGHMIDHRVRRALFVTDGWVGQVPDEHARQLRSRGTRVAVALTHDGEDEFSAALPSRVWRLPPLETHE
jgi:hypothetical protein